MTRRDVCVWAAGERSEEEAACCVFEGACFLAFVWLFVCGTEGGGCWSQPRLAHARCVISVLGYTGTTTTTTTALCTAY